MRLYVGNLAFATTNDELKAAFEAFGAVDSATVIMDRDTGRSKGFGFVDMNNDEEAKAAIAGLDGKPLGGRNIRVNEARPKEERPRGPRRFCAEAESARNELKKQDGSGFAGAVLSHAAIRGARISSRRNEAPRRAVQGNPAPCRSCCRSLPFPRAF